MESIAALSALIESAREMTLDATQASRNYTRNARPLDRAQVKKLLDSRNEREVIDGLRRVMSMMYRNQKTLPLFSSIVKNVASPNIEIKKLVYIYLIRQADQEPDLALLSINAIQKSLGSSSPQATALALRTMSGIRVPVISQIVSLAIKRCVSHSSAQVRRAAALAIPKCYRLDPVQEPALLEYLTKLLGDQQYFVVGAAVSAFLQICPKRMELIHPHYRSLVKKIVDMDEWGQIATLRLLTSYARASFPRQYRGREQKASKSPSLDSLRDVILDPELTVLLDHCRPLLFSRNSAVIVAVTRTFLELGTIEHIRATVGPLVALLRGSLDQQEVALYMIVSLCLYDAPSFVPYFFRFLIRSTDTPPMWRLKLEIWTLLFPHASADVKGLILSQLEYLSSRALSRSRTKDASTVASQVSLVREAVRAIGRCAQADETTSARCLRLLLNHITSLDGTVAAESLTVIRHLIQKKKEQEKDPQKEGQAAIALPYTAIVIRLAKNLDQATHPEARATIIWLVAEYAGTDGRDNIAPDVLRILLQNFAGESELAKMQIVHLAAVVYLLYRLRTDENSKDTTVLALTKDNENQQEGDAIIPKLWEYLLLLTRYDTSYDLRDRMRMYRELLAVPQLASLVLLAPKPAPFTPSPSESRRGYRFGSSTLVIGGGEEQGGKLSSQGIRGYNGLPDWVLEGEQPDPSLRHTNSSLDDGFLTSSKRFIEPATSTSDKAGSITGGFGRIGHEMSGSTDKVTSLISSSPYAKATVALTREKTLDDWLAEDDDDVVSKRTAPAEDSDEGGEDDEESEEESSEEEEDDEDEEEDDEEDEDESEDDSEDDKEAAKLIQTQSK